MERLVYKIEVFEGPLDVLLFLISKNKLNIYDIPISELLSQYLDYLHGMKEMNLDITSEFLEMASKLVQIKSAFLLPKPEQSEMKDPREELVMALIEYKTCKAMAEGLQCRSEGFNCFVREPVIIEHDESYMSIHDKSELYNALVRVKGLIKRRTPPPVSAFQAIMDRNIVSVASRIVHVLKSLLQDGAKPLNSVYEDSTGRSEAVATFLAVLDLIKSRRIVIDGSNGCETVKIVRSPSEVLKSIRK